MKQEGFLKIAQMDIICPWNSVIYESIGEV